ncbi:MAG: carboxy terminal-processing peptidase [Verrucomicrobiota bacterium]|nr:carboxy terminal-processing peptidase [Verrucomicrobiota bacterium]
MRQRVVLFLSLLLGSGRFAFSAAEPKPLAPEPHFKDIARILSERLPSEHLTGQPLDDTISKRAFEKYLAYLDPARIYFLESDVAMFGAHELTLDDELAEGDVAFAFDVFKVFVERVRNRAQRAAELLDRDMNLDADETYAWKRKNAGRAADDKAWDELWRKVVKNDYVAHVVAASVPNEEHDDEPADANTERRKMEDGKTEDGKKPAPTPKEVIAKRYRQHPTFVESHDAEWVLQRYLLAFTQAYDPHCDYMSPSLVKDFDIEMKLSLCGIGAVLNWDEGYIKIVRIMPGGPAGKDKRLKVGDRIVAVAQENEPDVEVFGWPLQKAVQIIRGAKGTRVALTVIPASDPGETDRKRIELVREEVKLEDQAARQEVREVKRADKTWRCGIARLPVFYGDVEAKFGDAEARSSARDVERILEAFNTNRIDGALLDLRGNGGGSLLEAARMTGLFIRRGPVVQVRQGRSVAVIPDMDSAVSWAGPLVILVDRGTASSSEILAGALQDYGRAVIVGDSSTHGKGTVQQIVKLGKDERLGRLKVTNGLFYRVSGGSTQLRGVSSDVVIPSLTETSELGETCLDYALEWTSVMPAPHPVYADLQPLTAKLAEQSRARLAADRNFAVYTNVLARLDAMRKTEVVPLQLAKRKAMAEIWRELRALRKKVAADHDDKKADVALDEGLNILADLAEVWPRADGNDWPAGSRLCLRPPDPLP